VSTTTDLGLPPIRATWRRPGLRCRWHSATTAQLASVYPWHSGLDLGARGVLLGHDVYSRAAVFYDPFELYTRKILSNPNMLILGDIGNGKSTTAKTFIYRCVGALRSPNGGPRWVGILDPKREYHALAEALGLQHVALRPGGTTRLNPLDPGPAAAQLGSDELMARRTGLVSTLLGSIVGRDLTPLEDAAVGWVMDHLTRECPQVAVPTLWDLHHLLGHPTPGMVQRARTTEAALVAGITDLRLATERMLERDLRGMFDGPSTLRTDLEGRGLVVDLSSVVNNPALLVPVMVCVTGWLQSLLARPVGDGAGPRRRQVIDEAWALLANERTARYLQASWRLARQWGVANIAITHTAEDLMAQADDGTAVAKVAKALVQVTDTVVHHHAKRCGPQAQDLLGLQPAEAAEIPRLRRGEALWRVAGRSTIVKHAIAPDERALVDTNQAMDI
jgi:hypothetical protein